MPKALETSPIKEFKDKSSMDTRSALKNKK
jgi:hypothetical protein